MSSLEVRPSLRLLCMGVGVLLLTAAIALWRAGDLAGNVGGIGAVAGFFLLVGTLGRLDEDEQSPPGSERFHELADPARSLSPEDFRQATPEIVHHEAGRDQAAPDSRSNRP
jgi:hypothetical protein